MFSWAFKNVVLFGLPSVSCVISRHIGELDFLNLLPLFLTKSRTGIYLVLVFLFALFFCRFSFICCCCFLLHNPKSTFRIFLSISFLLLLFLVLCLNSLHLLFVWRRFIFIRLRHSDDERGLGDLSMSSNAPLPFRLPRFRRTILGAGDSSFFHIHSTERKKQINSINRFAIKHSSASCRSF